MPALPRRQPVRHARVQPADRRGGLAERAARIQVGRHPNGISYDVDTRSVWVANAGDETVMRMDEKTARVTTRVSTKGPIAGQLAAAGGVVWAAGTNDVVRIEPVGSD